MTLPRRGSRTVIVDGVTYRWRVRTRPTAAQRTGRSPLGVAVERDDVRGATLVAVLRRLHPGSGGLERTYAVTPREVAAVVREALSAGWTPTHEGPQFAFRPASARVPSRTAEVGPPELTTEVIHELVAARTSRDTLRFGDTETLTWPGGGRYAGVRIEVSGKDLLDWVRDAERPHVERENANRGGEDPAYHLVPADYLPPPQTLRTSRELFGEVPSVEARSFVMEPSDRRLSKTTLLTCSCGVSECEFLLVRISVLPDVVVWSDFESFHRPWVYDLGPFVFDRQEYEAAFG
ncbi:MAG: hypothetical protein KC668_19685 [Myxococcales bacterium]|nr:hypothetical protein [Myxococcales bacterium]